MTRQEHEHLMGEKAFIERRLARTWPEDLITRSNLEQRLAEIEVELGQVQEIIPPPFYAWIYFRGAPIREARGILANFSGRALEFFSNTVALAGVSIDAPLESRSTIPRREEFDMLVTDLDRGSFGFKLEMASSQTSVTDPHSHLELAVTRVIDALESSARSDSETTQSLLDWDDRALNSLRSFLDLLSNNDALCGLRLENREFRFQNHDELRASAARLQADNIMEETIVIDGELQGILPDWNLVQIRDSQTDEIIRARVKPEKSADLHDINNFLYQPMRLTLESRRVGSSIPGYTMTKYEPVGARAEHENAP